MLNPIKLANKNFLSSLDTSSEEFFHILEIAKNYKNKKLRIEFKDKVLGLIFDKSSTRTRVSFQVAMSRLGGTTVDLNPSTSQIGRGEPIRDTARVLSGYCDVLAIRTFKQSVLEEYAKWATIPVINALTDLEHPCQALADFFTIKEEFGELKGKVLSYIGDGNNVCNSWIHASKHFDFNLKISCPPGNFPANKILESFNSGKVELFKNPVEAALDADVIITDTWVSMGMKSNPKRLKNFEKFQINKDLLKKTGRTTYFLHCLPAHRGCEVTDEIIDGENSLVWAEAENRLYAHQSILLWCLKKI